MVKASPSKVNVRVNSRRRSIFNLSHSNGKVSKSGRFKRNLKNTAESESEVQRERAYRRRGYVPLYLPAKKSGNPAQAPLLQSVRQRKAADILTNSSTTENDSFNVFDVLVSKGHENHEVTTISEEAEVLKDTDTQEEKADTAADGESALPDSSSGQNLNSSTETPRNLVKRRRRRRRISKVACNFSSTIHDEEVIIISDHEPSPNRPAVTSATEVEVITLDEDEATSSAVGVIPVEGYETSLSTVVEAEESVVRNEEETVIFRHKHREASHFATKKFAVNESASTSTSSVVSPPSTDAKVPVMKRPPSYFCRLPLPGALARNRFFNLGAFIPPPAPSLPQSFLDGTVQFNDMLTKGTAEICRTLLRQWNDVQKVSPQGVPFRVCSYNVLCQDTVAKTAYLYRHLSHESRQQELQWNFRSSLLAREFQMIGADILCLQEVQEDHFDTFYKFVLQAGGYEGKFKKRTRDMVDGCAIFYRGNFELLRYTDIEYFVSEKCVLDRDNIGQLARFRDKNSGKEFCVANTHLLFNKKRGDVKMAQLALLLAHIDEECGLQSGRDCPYIICGDFNIEPFSPIYNFLMNGKLHFGMYRQFDLSGQGHFGGPIVRNISIPPETNVGLDCRFKHSSADSTAPCKKSHMTHHLQLASSYEHIDVNSLPEISTFHSAEAGNPDFLFYSIKRKDFRQQGQLNAVGIHEGSLKLVRRLALPNEAVLTMTLGPWPNAFAPSDHIPLIADFLLI